MASSPYPVPLSKRAFQQSFPEQEELGPLDKGQTTTVRVVGLEDPVVPLSWRCHGPYFCAMLYTCQPAALHSATEDISLPPSVQLVHLYALWPKECVKKQQRC